MSNKNLNSRVANSVNNKFITITMNDNHDEKKSVQTHKRNYATFAECRQSTDLINKTKVKNVRIVFHNFSLPI